MSCCSFFQTLPIPQELAKTFARNSSQSVMQEEEIKNILFRSDSPVRHCMKCNPLDKLYITGLLKRNATNENTPLVSLKRSQVSIVPKQQLPSATA